MLPVVFCALPPAFWACSSSCYVTVTSITCTPLIICLLPPSLPPCAPHWDPLHSDSHVRLNLYPAPPTGLLKHPPPLHPPPCCLPSPAACLLHTSLCMPVRFSAVLMAMMVAMIARWGSAAARTAPLPPTDRPTGRQTAQASRSSTNRSINTPHCSSRSFSSSRPACLPGTRLKRPSLPPSCLPSVSPSKPYIWPACLPACLLRLVPPHLPWPEAGGGCRSVWPCWAWKRPATRTGPSSPNPPSARPAWWRSWVLVLAGGHGHRHYR